MLRPTPVETMNIALEQMIPRAHQMGVTFVEMRPGYVRAELPFEGNGNHFGTVYAGVIFTLAERYSAAPCTSRASMPPRTTR